MTPKTPDYLLGQLNEKLKHVENVEQLRKIIRDARCKGFVLRTRRGSALACEFTACFDGSIQFCAKNALRVRSHRVQLPELVGALKIEAGRSE